MFVWFLPLCWTGLSLCLLYIQVDHIQFKAGAWNIHSMIMFQEADCESLKYSLNRVGRKRKTATVLAE
jgi:hypothetical protein